MNLFIPRVVMGFSLPKGSSAFIRTEVDGCNKTEKFIVLKYPQEREVPFPFNDQIDNGENILNFIGWVLLQSEVDEDYMYREDVNYLTLLLEAF
jgi:hypothetical protein